MVLRLGLFAFIFLFFFPFFFLSFFLLHVDISQYRLPIPWSESNMCKKRESSYKSVFCICHLMLRSNTKNAMEKTELEQNLDYNFDS